MIASLPAQFNTGPTHSDTVVWPKSPSLVSGGGCTVLVSVMILTTCFVSLGKWATGLLLLRQYLTSAPSVALVSGGTPLRSSLSVTIDIYIIHHIGNCTYTTFTVFLLTLGFPNSSLLYPISLQRLELILLITGLTKTAANHKSPPHFLPFHTFSGPRSIFNFLRCLAQRRLPPSRTVLLDGDEYQIMRIGKGAFATISRVLHKPSADLRVMKRIVFDKAGFAKELSRAEVDSLKAMAGNFWFPSLLNHFADDDEFIITIPFYGRGDMAGLIEHKSYLCSELAQFYCAQLILAIQCLHKQGIIHRDIKPDNIFLSDGGHLILADLGLAENIGTFRGTDAEMDDLLVWKEARMRNGEDYPLLWVDGTNPLGSTELAGTYWYTAPEVFRKERYSFGVDYYSVGVIYYELVTGKIPFDNYKPYPEDKRPVVDCRWKRGQLKHVTSWEEKAVMEIIAPDPINRPQSVNKLKASALFDGVDWKKMASRDIPPPPLPLPLCEG